MLQSFVKMHALGNDFVVFDAMQGRLELSPELVRCIADRQRGVGCDQVLVVEPPSSPEVDFDYRIFNADGGEVDQCGNGARCFARFVREQGWTDKTRIVAGTRSRKLVLECLDDGRVRVDMGVPSLEPEHIPFVPPGESGDDGRYAIPIPGQETVRVSVVGMGNPHAVLAVEDVDTAPVADIGAGLAAHHAFPKSANVGFMQTLARNRIRLRVYERGAGETMACGSGACAAVVAGRLLNDLAESVRAVLNGGELQIDWAGPGHALYMTGPATRVFKGELETQLAGEQTSQATAGE